MYIYQLIIKESRLSTLLISSSDNHLVKVDGLGADVTELARAVRVTSGDLLSVDVGNAEVSLGFLLGVDDGHDSESVVGTELRAVSPGNVDGRAGGARKVGPRLGGCVLHIETDNGARLNGTVVARGEVEVVVTARLVLGAVAAQVLDGPGQALGNGLAAGRSSGGDSGDGAGSSLGGSGRGDRCGSGGAVTTGNGGSVAEEESRGRGRRGCKGKSTIG